MKPPRKHRNPPILFKREGTCSVGRDLYVLSEVKDAKPFHLSKGCACGK